MDLRAESESFVGAAVLATAPDRVTAQWYVVPYQNEQLTPH